MPVVLDWLGRVGYPETWAAMRTLTDQRTPDSPDRLWFLEHPAVFTLGQAGKQAHLLAPGAIPVVVSDRGGQVTYHGPGQLLVYTLLDLKRRRMGIRDLVTRLEDSVINLLAEHHIPAVSRRDAPGVYVHGAKVAALGLRVRRSCSYHGLALNVAMDLEPFQRINPCGYAGLAVTDCRSLGLDLTVSDAARGLCLHLLRALQVDPGSAHWRRSPTTGVQPQTLGVADV